ncbi:protein-lysine methyltransferase METTL21D-like [Lytechinus variegatus]|uniref:protein-lysine methyltransferase METTL21D-like n=1 Tax=Lytechinus variegatus TaxID=7654 RepID=UPI001BB25B89|nr:protein-lysine methyltransferase METTL21D-like [Lytechinus variegatus]
MDESQLYPREIECEDGTCLMIQQSYVGDVGCVVWDAALVLSKYLETEGFSRRFGELKSKRLLELGAGTGATGLVACKLGSEVILTDLEEFVPLMELNIKNNQSALNGSATAKVLKWGEDISDINPLPELVLMSDCVYYPEAVEPLVRTLCDLSKDGAAILCCYEERTIGQNAEAHQLFDKLMEPHFLVEEIPRQDLDPVYNSDEIHVMWYRRKDATLQDQPS